MIRWSQQQIDFLLENYGKITSKEISISIGIHQKSVIYKAKQLGLKSSLTRKSSTIFDKVKYSGHIPLEPIGNTHSKMRFLCAYCKVEFSTTPDSIASGKTKSCGCYRPNARKGTANISRTFFTRCRRLAEARNIEFHLTIGYLESLLQKQNFKCALTGETLLCGYDNNITMSVDRIDSSIGYIEGNVQWVHKMINVCKNSYSQQEFIEMCSKVYGYQLTMSC